jgi:Spy/CpxP family protein refolding chaperone
MSHPLRTTLLALGFTTLGAVAALGTQAIAGPGMGPGSGVGYGRGVGAGGHGPMARIDALMEDLDLTEAQQAEASALRDELRETFMAHRADRDEDAETLRQALQTEPTDAKAIHALIDTRHAAMLETAHDVAEAVLEFWAVLEPTQRAVVLDRIERLRERRERVRDALAE